MLAARGKGTGWTVYSGGGAARVPHLVGSTG